MDVSTFEQISAAILHYVWFNFMISVYSIQLNSTFISFSTEGIKDTMFT